jgi:hypothetical protein
MNNSRENDLSLCNLNNRIMRVKWGEEITASGIVTHVIIPIKEATAYPDPSSFPKIDYSNINVKMKID